MAPLKLKYVLCGFVLLILFLVVHQLILLFYRLIKWTDEDWNIHRSRQRRLRAERHRNRLRKS